MNQREEWQNRNPYLKDYGHHLPAIPPLLNVSANNWTHVLPQTMPWGIPVESQPLVVRFTAGDHNAHPIAFKRKSNESLEIPPAKVVVTEEKMAAHLQSLHISDVDSKVEPMVTNMNYKDEAMETEPLPRLFISDEIKNMKTETILPQSILKRLEKPEMALVLWQPPPADLNSKLKELKKLSKMKAKDKSNKKEEVKQTDYLMDVEGKDDQKMEIGAVQTDSSISSGFTSVSSFPRSATQMQYFQSVFQ